jgi:RHS repeat-associated protein
MVRDGLTNLTYNQLNNRISNSGFQYDEAGNQTRAIAENGTDWHLFEYDAANRLTRISKDNGPGNPPTLLQTQEFGIGNDRISQLDNVTNQRTYYYGSIEYAETNNNGTLLWSKSYIHLGDSVLSTITPNGSGGETVEYNHPDRLGTKVVTNQQTGTSFEQNTLPFGTALAAESSGSSAKRFTSYERSSRTGLDYAQNRTYDSKQGRFTQVDPIGMKASSLIAPQTLNLYTYCGNDPINHTDPDGLFFWKTFQSDLENS